MKQFIEKNFTIIVFILLIFIFFKGCNDSRELTKVKNEMSALRDSVATKSDIRVLNEKTEDLKNTIYGFGDSFNFVLGNVIEKSTENNALKMYTKKVEQLNKVK